jgi:hypothetical protein
MDGRDWKLRDWISRQQCADVVADQPQRTLAADALLGIGRERREATAPLLAVV